MPAANSILRTRSLRLLAFLSVTVLATASAMASAERAPADALHPATTTTLTVSPASATPGQTVTLTATVTGVGGAPTGTVEFDNNTSSGPVDLTGGSPVPLVATTATTSQAVFQLPFATGDYSLTAHYSSSDIVEP